MSAQLDTDVHFRCPGDAEGTGCGKPFATQRRHAGRRTRCPGCGCVVVVPGALSATADVLQLDSPEGAPSGAAAPEDPLIGLPCLLCQTRIYVPRSAIGQKVRCPDCHAVNDVVEPKAPPKVSRTPAAMEGLQYQVYSGEEQPWGVDLARAAPKSIHLECVVCQTHLVASPGQVGSRLVCPDCGAKTLVKPPKAEPARKEVLVETGAEYEAEAASETPDLGLFESYLKAPPLEHRLRLEAGADTPEGARAFAGLAEAPPGAIWRGLVRFWRSPRVAVAWLGLATLLAAILAFLALGAACLSGGAGILFMPMGLTFYGAAGFTTLALVGVATALGTTIVEASSVGADRVSHWPGNDFSDWYDLLPRGVVGLSFVVAPGALVATGAIAVAPQLAPQLEVGWVALVALVLGGVMTAIVAPVVVLSQLSADAWWCVVSPSMLRTILRRPLAWTAFWLQSLVLGAATVALDFAAEWGLHLIGAFLGCGVIAAAIVSYARQLGRLAWVIADAGSEAERAPAGAEARR
ncbi:MAG: hypothetical protein ACRCT8_12810 [Lacipirellulaceae bacterium]